MTPSDWLSVVSTAATQPFGYQLRCIAVVGPMNPTIRSGLKTDSFNHKLASAINIKARVDG